MSSMYFSKQLTRPDSSQPAACSMRFAPARNAGVSVFSDSSRGLRVDRDGGGQPAAAGAPQEAIAPCDLAGHEQADRRLGPAEARRARLHVGVRDERAHDRGRARPHELRQHHAGQGLGGLLGQRRRDRDGTHRAHQDERRDHVHLVRLGEGEQRLDHARVEAQRRVGVDDAEQRGRGLDRAARPPCTISAMAIESSAATGSNCAPPYGLSDSRDQRHLQVEVARLDDQVGRVADG